MGSNPVFAPWPISNTNVPAKILFRMISLLQARIARPTSHFMSECNRVGIVFQFGGYILMEMH
ncbi:MAG: hypothetical protein JRI32_02400 [Deltaproteobacteria bacterium]|nr:hypothetical protein [Deltaproteobacteria bacterium]